MEEKVYCSGRLGDGTYCRVASGLCGLGRHHIPGDSVPAVMGCSWGDVPDVPRGSSLG